MLSNSNLYAYCFNNTLIWIDPTGLLSFDAEYKSGLAGFGKIKVGPLNLQADINFGTQHYSLFNPNYVSQELVVKGDIVGYGLGLGFSRRKEGEAHAPQFAPHGRVIPGTGKSIPNMLKNEEWGSETGFLTPIGNYGWASVNFGLQFLIGFEVSMDFTFEAVFWHDIFKDLFENDKICK